MTNPVKHCQPTRRWPVKGNDAKRQPLGGGLADACAGRRRRPVPARGSLQRLAIACFCGFSFGGPAGAAWLEAPAPPAQTSAVDVPWTESWPSRPPPGHTRALLPPRVTVPPEIDGSLGDLAWSQAPVSSGFWVISQGRWPDEPTKVMAVVDDHQLYIAIHAIDSRPGQIVALETVRDRGLGNDDQVRVEIDAFGDHEGASRFSVNAVGTQDDEIAGGRAAKMSWKGHWYAAAQRVDDGWVAELAIPFEILNYRPGTAEIAINFSRYHNRSRQWSRWADVTPQNKKEEMGRLVGLELPTRDGTAPWTIMPFVLAGQNVPDREGDVKDFLVTGGVDIRYTPRSNLTGVLSLNPDFSQVEQQFAAANFSYTERRVGDPRVFFIEGADYFGEDERIFYSPRVPDFDAGTKVFGQSRSARYSGFVTSAPDSRTDGLARLSIATDATHSGFMTFVGTDRAEGSGSTLGVGFQGREDFGGIWDIEYIYTDNDFEETGQQSGGVLDMTVGWRGDYTTIGVDYDNYDKRFDPANGLIKTDRLGTTGQSIFLNFFRDFGPGRISQASFNVERSSRDTDDGRSQSDNWYVGGSLEWQEFVRTRLSYSDGYYRPESGDGPGEFGGTENHDRFWTAGVDLNTRSSRLGLGSSLSSGQLGGDDYDYLVSYLWARPTSNTSASVVAERLESFGTFEQYVIEAGWDVNPTNALVFRHVLSDGDEYWRFGYSRFVTQGMDIFMLYDDSPATGAQVSVKFLWVISPKAGRNQASGKWDAFFNQLDGLKRRAAQ